MVAGGVGAPVLHRPADLVALPGGGLAVLDAEACRVTLFSPAAAVTGGFGRCGDGPGELSGATDLAFAGETFFVFRPGRVDWFDAAGTYLATDSLGGAGLTRPIFRNGVFVGCATDDPGTVRTWDPATGESRELGRDWGRCRVQPWHAGRILVADLMTGQMRVIATGGTVLAAWGLGLARGAVVGAMVRRREPVLDGAWWSPDTGLLVAVREDAEREGRMALRWYRGDDPAAWDLVLLPRDLHPARLVAGGRHRLFALPREGNRVDEFLLPDRGDKAGEG